MSLPALAIALCMSDCQVQERKLTENTRSGVSQLEVLIWELHPISETHGWNSQPTLLP